MVFPKCRTAILGGVGSPLELGYWAHSDLQQASRYTSGIFTLTKPEWQKFSIALYKTHVTI